MNFLRSPPPSLGDRIWLSIRYPYDLLQPAQPSLIDRVWLSFRSPYDVLKHPLNAFFSIPFLPYLLIPTFTSYTTSLNLLFFYFTWSTLILSNSPLKIELYGSLAIRVLFFVLPSLGFFLFDCALPSLAVRIKEHGDGALPLSDEHGGKTGRWWKVVLASIGNVLLGIMLQGVIEYILTEALHVRSALKVTTAIPMPWDIALDLIRGLLLREILTYGLHRYALHSEFSSLRDQHIAWQHSIPAPYSFVANYDHPVPYLLHVFLPAYLPAVLFRFHILTYHVYLALVSLEETFAYSGYNALPSGLILGGIARRQERHLMGGGKGNYGCFGATDFVFGTGVGEDVLEDAREEAEKRRLGEKAKGKARGVGRKVRRE